MTKDEAAAEVQYYLNELRPVFIHEAQLTFIMRVPGQPETHMIISNDNMGELSELLAAQEAADNGA